MRILLDENIPVQLKNYLGEAHEWVTIKELNWQGTKNGQLLQMLGNYQFDGLITMDKNMYKQQNLLKLNLFLIVLEAVDNKIPTLQTTVPSINKLLHTALQPGIYFVKADK